MFTNVECELKEKENSRLWVVGFVSLFNTGKLYLSVSGSLQLHTLLHRITFGGLTCYCLLTAGFSWLKSSLSCLSWCFFTIPIYFLPSFHVSPDLPQETTRLFSVKCCPRKEGRTCPLCCVVAEPFIATEQKLAFFEKNDFFCAWQPF